MREPVDIGAANCLHAFDVVGDVRKARHLFPLVARREVRHLSAVAVAGAVAGAVAVAVAVAVAGAVA